MNSLTPKSVWTSCLVELRAAAASIDICSLLKPLVLFEKA